MHLIAPPNIPGVFKMRAICPSRHRGTRANECGVSAHFLNCLNLSPQSDRGRLDIMMRTAGERRRRGRGTGRDAAEREERGAAREQQDRGSGKLREKRGRNKQNHCPLSLSLSLSLSPLLICFKQWTLDVQVGACAAKLSDQ